MHQKERSKTAGTIRLHPSFNESGVSLNTDTEIRTLPDNDMKVQSKEHVSNRQSSNFDTNMKSWLSQHSLKQLQEKSDFGSTAVKNMYECLLDNEKDLQDGMETFLQHNQCITTRKRELLLKKWHRNAFTPLNNKIGEVMDGPNYTDLDKKKRILYGNYLSHRNKKGHVFLDVISKDEYDPMSLNSERPGPLKACVPKLEDPLLHQQNERNEEDRSVIACTTGRSLPHNTIELQRLPALPLVPLGRHGATCNKWLGMKFKDIQSDVRVRSQAKFNKSTSSTRNHSKMPLQEFKGAATELEVFDKKNNWKKRRQFPMNNNTTDLLI